MQSHQETTTRSDEAWLLCKGPRARALSLQMATRVPRAAGMSAPDRPSNDLGAQMTVSMVSVSVPSQLVL